MTGPGDRLDPARRPGPDTDRVHAARDRAGMSGAPTPGRAFEGMPRPRAQPLFLARSRYRHRRLRDVARLMPVLAALVWLFPLLWRTDTATDTAGTASAAVFLFAGWAILIAAAWALSRRIDLADPADPDPSDPAA